MGISPTQRSLAECRKRGWPAQVVEKWVPQAKRRVDLFGFGDIVALDGEPGVLAIQATSDSHVSDRVRKIREECTEAADAWLALGNRIQVWGWGLKGKRGERKRWTLRCVPIYHWRVAGY